MAKTFVLEIITLRRTVYSGMVTSVIPSGTRGKFGVLARHAPMISSLETGALKIREPGGKEVLAFVGKGFLMVEKDHVVILPTQAEMASEIDTERARASMERAKKRLGGKSPDLDMSRAKASLARALTRLKVADAS
ncbi:MAG: F0F1 ATP synthase subunit epsilon [Thermodesulfobacteriota bacterium]